MKELKNDPLAALADHELMTELTLREFLTAYSKNRETPPRPENNYKQMGEFLAKS
jgi:hypothetical protein